MSNHRLRVAVVGVGYLGSIHARIYARMDHVELVGVVDSNADTADIVAQECGCSVYPDINALFDKIDAVSVVVPTSHHAEVTLPFVEHGIHVMLEKPIAATIQEAEEIVKRAEAKNVVLQIGHLERFNAGVMALAENAVNPRFIEVHRLGTFVERATDVDVVTDLMIHDIDIVLTLVKRDITSISAVGLPVVTKHVDIANARLEFVNGAVANVSASRISNKKFRRIRVFAESQYLALNFQDQQIEIVKTGESSTEGGFPQIVTSRIDVTPKQPLDAELEHFVETVHHLGKPLVSGRDGLAALEIAEQVKAKISESLEKWH